MILLTVISLIHLAWAAVDTDICGDDYHVSNAGNCYMVVDEIHLTWRDAKQFCYENYGASLVKFADLSEEASAAPQNSSTSYWIGANAFLELGKYRWLNEEDLTSYTNWGVDQPVQDADQNCVALGAYNGNWSNLYCDTALPFICGYQTSYTAEEFRNAFAHENWLADGHGANESDSTATDPEKSEATDVGENNNTGSPESSEANSDLMEDPKIEDGNDGCPNGWVMMGDLGCVTVYRDKKRTWQEARDNCQANGGDLMIVPDFDTHRAVKDFFRHNRKSDKKLRSFRYWFGLTLLHGDRSVWLEQVEKDPHFFRMYSKRDLSLSKPLCGTLVGWKSGRWDTVKCDEPHYSICMENSAIEHLLNVARAAYISAPKVNNGQPTTTQKTPQSGSDVQAETQPEVFETIVAAPLNTTAEALQN